MALTQPQYPLFSDPLDLFQGKLRWSYRGVHVASRLVSRI